MVYKNFFDLLTDARNLLYQKKQLYIKVLNASIESFPEINQLYGKFSAHIKVPTTIQLTTEYSDTYNRVEAEYVIPYSDLEDGSEVDKFANIPVGMNDKDKTALRLAYILYDGNKFVSSGGCHDKDLLEKGWHTRVTKMNITHWR